MKDYKRHPLSADFGDLNEEDFGELKASIALHGVIENTIYTMDGQILDGWNRLRAVTEIREQKIELAVGASLELAFVEYDGDDPVGFVLARNLVRRHISDKGRRAAIVVSVNGWRGRGRANPDAMTASEMAETSESNLEYIRQSKRLMREAPELFELVKRGQMRIQEATATLKNRIKEEEWLQELAGEDGEFEDLAEQVRNGQIEKEEASLHKSAWLEMERRIGNLDESLQHRVRGGELPIDDAEIENAKLQRISKLSEYFQNEIRNGHLDIAAAELQYSYYKIWRENGHDSDLADAVDTHEMSWDDAEVEANRRNRERAQMNLLKNRAPDLYNKVIDGEITYEEARQIADDREDEEHARKQREAAEKQREEARQREEERKKREAHTEHAWRDMNSKSSQERVSREPLGEFGLQQNVRGPVNQIAKSVSEGGYTPEDIKKIKRKFLLQTHPDKVGLDKLTDAQQELWHNIVTHGFNQMMENLEKGMNGVPTPDYQL